MSPRDLMGKIEREGGVYEAIACYGLNAESLTEATSEQRRCWEAVVTTALALQSCCEDMFIYFPDIEGDE